MDITKVNYPDLSPEQRDRKIRRIHRKVQMMIGGIYELDSEQIKLNAYRLICLFYASKEISRLSDPLSPTASARLEEQFFRREMTHLLLQIAIALRVMEDQILDRETNDPKRREYLARRNETNKNYQCMMFDQLTMRQVCNKIIHALIVEPHVTDADKLHSLDEREAAYADANELEEQVNITWTPIDWQHLTGNVRLCGREGKEEWYYILEVPTFVEAISSLLHA